MSTHCERGRHGGRLFVHKCLHTAMSLIIYIERRGYITHNNCCCLGAAAAPANLKKKIIDLKIENTNGDEGKEGECTRYRRWRRG